jgi:hypothetical protein
MTSYNFSQFRSRSWFPHSTAHLRSLVHPTFRLFTWSTMISEPTGFSEPPDCVSGLFIRQWPAVAEPERWADNMGTVL